MTRATFQDGVQQQPPVTRASLREIAWSFLKLGTIAFGGPAAHIAMMEDEFVRKRNWITREDFLDRLAAANLIPGPTSTEMTIFIGYSKGGWPGLVVAGSCFIIPAAVMVSLIAAAYVRFGSLPAMAGILYAIKPAVIAVVVQALWKLAQTAAKTKLLIVIGIVSAILSFRGLSPLPVLGIAGLAAGLAWLGSARKASARSLIVLPPTERVAAAIPLFSASVSVFGLFLSFLKIGSIVFGSGYVLLAFLRSEFVDRLHWLSEKQLIDAVAVGQFTPGPVFTTATFIGYVLAGVPGAVASTVGIFLPGFLFVAASGPLITKIRRSQLAGAVLDGVVMGSLALMAVVAWQLGRVALVDWMTIAIFVVSAALLLRYRINSAWLVGGAALVGWIVKG